MKIVKILLNGILLCSLTNVSAFADGDRSRDWRDEGASEARIAALESEVAELRLSSQAENEVFQGVITSLTKIVDDLVEQQRCHTRPGDLQADSDGNYNGGVNWSGCDKTGLAMWGPVVGGGANEVLTNANLAGVNFTLANLIGIYAGGANLDGARFVNASLAYSDFGGAMITSETVFINTTCPDETNSDYHNGGTCAGHMIYGSN